MFFDLIKMDLSPQGDHWCGWGRGGGGGGGHLCGFFLCYIQDYFGKSMDFWP